MRLNLLAMLMFLALSSCGVDGLKDGKQMMLAVEFDANGKWVDVKSECKKAYINVTEERISESEITCEIAQHEMNAEIIKTIRGKNCRAEGNELDDFSFSFRFNRDETIDYKNSGETIWTQIKECPSN